MFLINCLIFSCGLPAAWKTAHHAEHSIFNFASDDTLVNNIGRSICQPGTFAKVIQTETRVHSDSRLKTQGLSYGELCRQLQISKSNTTPIPISNPDPISAFNLHFRSAFKLHFRSASVPSFSHFDLTLHVAWETAGQAMTEHQRCRIGTGCRVQAIYASSNWLSKPKSLNTRTHIKFEKSSSKEVRNRTLIQIQTEFKVSSFV